MSTPTPANRGTNASYIMYLESRVAELEAECENCLSSIPAESELSKEVNRLNGVLDSIINFQKDSYWITTWQDAYNKLVNIAKEGRA